MDNQYMDLRLDRLATLYVVSPLKRLASEERLAIPILMYHSIAEEDESTVSAYYRTSTSPAAFSAQMEHLHRNGYETSSLAQAGALLQSSCKNAIKCVVITFDDGYRNFYREAFPILSRFDFTATVFLPTAYIGDSALTFQGRECLTWREIRELHNYGISFGSHTVNHPQLRYLDEDSIGNEIVYSKIAIEQEIGRAVESFAYPYAFPQTETEFIKVLRGLLLRAQYRNGVCTSIGRAKCDSDPFFMRRLPINSFDDSALLRAKLRGAYDWLSKTQYAFKAAKSCAARIGR